MCGPDHLIGEIGARQDAAAASVLVASLAAAGGRPHVSFSNNRTGTGTIARSCSL